MKSFFLILILISILAFPDFRTGVKLFNEGKYEEALLRFEELMREQPDQWQSFYFAGLCYQKLGKIDKAKEAFEAGLKLTEDLIIKLPLAQIYFSEKNYEKVIEILKNTNLEGIENELKKSHYKILATSLYILGRYEEAIPHYKEYLALEGDPTMKYRAGYCLYKTGNHKEAAQLLEEAIKSNPEDRDALSLLSTIYLELSSAEPEKKDFYLNEAEKTGLKLLKISLEYNYLLAKIYMMEGKYKEASFYFEEATKQKESVQSCYAHYYLGFIKAKLENLKGALSSFDSAEKCLKDEAALKRIYCQKGLIYHSQSDFKKAIEFYKKGNCSKDLIEEAEKGQTVTEAIKRMQELLDQLQDITKMK